MSDTWKASSETRS